jgi:hypothetical protein
VVFNVGGPYVYFEAKLVVKPPRTSPETYDARAERVPVFVNQPGKVGEGPLTMDVVDAWWQHMDGCTVAVAKGDGTFRVLAIREDETGFRMWIDPGDASVQPTITCRDRHGRVTIVIPLPGRSLGACWRDPNAYGPQPPDGYELTGWQQSEPGVLVKHETKSWAVQDGELTLEWDILVRGGVGLHNQ